MSFFEAIILGLVEGITEFLPISSTAHLMMTSKILAVTQNEFLKSFEIVIQFGAIAAVIFLFGRRLAKSPRLWKKIAIAFLPTAIIGFLLYELIKTRLIGNLTVAVWGLIIGGLALIIVEHFFLKKPTRLDDGAGRNDKYKLSGNQPNQTENDNQAGGNLEDISHKQAFFIGAIQAVSVIPGVSRAAATIIPALFFGASRKAAAEFSFMLAVPTVAAAAGYDIIKNLDVWSVNGNIALLGIGFLVSFLAAIASIKFMLSYVQNHSFTAFGVYRILVAGLFFLLFV